MGEQLAGRPAVFVDTAFEVVGADGGDDLRQARGVIAERGEEVVAGLHVGHAGASLGLGKGSWVSSALRRQSASAASGSRAASLGWASLWRLK